MSASSKILVEIAVHTIESALAAEKGTFPLFDAKSFLAAPHVGELPADIVEEIRRHGVRNGLLTSIAPTGTISLLADNVSSGIEPVFAYAYSRKVLMPDGTRKEETVQDYAYREFRGRFGEDAALPDYFVTAQTLSPMDHLAVQSAAQRHVDSSISKTINVPEAISFDDFKDVYLRAYDAGCKGCTTYRPNSVTGAVLAEQAQDRTDTASFAPLQEPILPRDPNEPTLPFLQPALSQFRESGGVVYMTRPLDRPDVLIGQTYKIRWLDSDHAFYITINDIEQDGRRRPFEVFVNSKNMDAYAWTVALTRMISAVFRRGGDVSFVVDELKAVFDPRGGQWMGGRYIPSLLAAIGDVIERHLVAIGFMTPRDAALPPAELRAVAAAAEGAPARRCPRCGSPSFVRLENCDSCVSCGYSKCS